MSKRIQLLLLVLLFIMPPVAAYVLFFSDFRPTSRANYGELVQPPRPIGSAELEAIDGKPASLSQLEGKWTLLYLADSECDEVCHGNLYKIHQVRLAQGKNIGRVSSVCILPAGAGSKAVESIMETYPGVTFLFAAREQHSSLNRLLTGSGLETLQPAKHVYIVDPIGNIMMFYDADADPSGMRKDLKRLLKISQLG